MVKTLIERQEKNDRETTDAKLSSAGYETFRRQWLKKKEVKNRGKTE